MPIASFRLVMCLLLLSAVGIARGQSAPAADSVTHSAGLIVVKPPAPGEMSDAMWERELHRHAVQLTHDSLLSEVADASATLDWLREHVRAEVVPHSDLIRVYVADSQDPKAAQRLIESIVDKYIEQQKAIAMERMKGQLQSLNNAKFRLETRIREVCDRQSNLILNLNLMQTGNAAQSSVTVETDHYLLKLAEIETEGVRALAKYQALLKRVDEKDPQAIAAQTAIDETAMAQTELTKRVEQMKGVLGDVAIKMSDYNATTEELQKLRLEYSQLKSQLDLLASQDAPSPVEWAAHPADGSK